MNEIKLPLPPVQDPARVVVIQKQHGGFFRWLGRVTMWFVFLPVGIWLSIRHGRKVSEQRMLTSIQEGVIR